VPGRLRRRDFLGLAAGAAAAAAAGPGCVGFFKKAGLLDAFDGPGARYLAEVDKTLAQLAANEGDRIEEAGKAAAERIAAGGRLVVRGPRGALGHESSDRAAAFMAVRPASPEAGATDALIAAAWSDDDGEMAGLAGGARGRGAFVVGIAPRKVDADRCVSASSDVFISTGGEPWRVGLVSDVKAGSTVGVGSLAAAWAVQAEIAERLAAAGRAPAVWMSRYVTGAKGANAEARRRLAENGF
jgi:uncharacterized phosphosugar-binding protein